MNQPDAPIVEAVPSSYEQRARARIKSWLHATGMAQVDLGVRIGKNQPWMSRYLSGEIDADLATLEAMAGVFGHSLTALLDLPLDPQEARLLEYYRALPARARPNLLDLLANLLRASKPRA